MNRASLLAVLALSFAIPACAAETVPSEGTSEGADTASKAETVHLGTAGFAQRIDVTYTPSSVLVEGDSITSTGANVKLAVSGLPSEARAVRAVVVDACGHFGRSLFEIVMACDLASSPSGVWSTRMTEASCTLLTHPDNTDTAFPNVLVERRTREGDDIRCAQEIAVVADGAWLTDPISGGHNFGFQMKGGN